MELDPKTGLTILDPPECWELLASSEVGRLAVSIDGQPDIFPINHVVDDGTVVFRTAPGTKLAASVLGRGVAFEVDGYEPADGIAWSVVVKGTAREMGTMDELLEVEGLPLFPWAGFPKRRWVRIDPDSITGRRFHALRPGEDS